MRSKFLSRLSAVTLAAVVAAGCSDQSAGAREDVDVTMQQTDAMLAQVVSGWYASVTGGSSAAAAVDPDTVAKLVVRVTDIEFLREGGDEASAGAWIPLELSAPVLLDLMALPTEGESPLVVASGTVEVGNYSNVRLFTDSASIQFKGDISLGGAVTLEGGMDILVDTPSGAETGLKTDASFTVEADAEGNINDVALLFSPGSTFLNVTATGTDGVILAPVIRGAAEAQ